MEDFPQTPAGPDVYDDAFSTRPRWIAGWKETAQRDLFLHALELLGTDGSPIIELGCGTGQFAELLSDRAFPAPYIGYDFSRVGIRMAGQRCPSTIFGRRDLVADPPVFPDPCRVVAFEFLEHILDDLFIVGLIPVGSLLVASVPTFGSSDHMRHFKNEEQVASRYGSLIEVVGVRPEPVPGQPLDNPSWFLFSGRRRAST